MNAWLFKPNRFPWLAKALLFPLTLTVSTLHGTEQAPSSSVDDLVGLFQKLRSDSEVVIPAGTYRVCDTGLRGLTVKGLSDVTISAEGVTLLLKPGQGLTFQSCRNIKLAGLTIDFDPLPFSQGTIEAIDQGAKQIRVALDPGYPDPESLARRNPHVDALLYFVFDPKTLRPRPLLWEGFRESHAMADGRWQFGAPTSDKFFGEIGRPTAPREGDKIAFFSRGSAALSLKDCTSFRLERITVHASPGYAFFEDGGAGGHHYFQCRIVPPEGSQRLLATAADGFHSYLTRRGPLIEECEFGDTADDTIAIHGFFSVVAGRPAARRVQLVSPFGPDFEEGDELEFYAIPHGQPLGAAKILQMREADDTEVQVPFKDQLAAWAREGLRTRRIPQMTVRDIELDADLDLPGDGLVLVSCRRLAGSGAVVKNNTIRRSHKRGILVKADNVTIEGNRLEDVAGQSILIEPELFWLEGPLPRGVTIRGNTVLRSGWRSINHQTTSLGLGGAIEVRANLPRRQFPVQADPYPLMENFTIEGNTMRDSGTYALVLGNVRGAQVRDNLIDGVFRRPGLAGSRGLERVFDAKEHEAGAVSRTAAGAAAVLVFASEDVEFSGNKIDAGEGIEPVAVGPWCRDITGAP